MSESSPEMPYRRCGRSGVLLPAISLGLWHNFGAADDAAMARALLRRAFDLGIVHFDLANNYGPPPGAAESRLGEILASDFAAHRDELIIATKAGFEMGTGPHGRGGSRKHLVSSLDASLARLRLDYVDIYYHHVPDPQTPLDETAAALDHLVRSGRALYVGLSNYPTALALEAAARLQRLGTPCLVHQFRYNLLERSPEGGLLAAMAAAGIGCVAYSPLAQGLLSERYRGGMVPPDSRAATSRFLRPADLTPANLRAARTLATLAAPHGLTASQLALAWLLQRGAVTSVLVGASRLSNLDDAARAAVASPLDAHDWAEVEDALAPAA